MCEACHRAPRIVNSQRENHKLRRVNRRLYLYSRKMSTKREIQLIVILDTVGDLFSDLSVCQESTVCLQTPRKYKRNLDLVIVYALPTVPQNSRHYNRIEDPILTLVATGALGV